MSITPLSSHTLTSNPLSIRPIATACCSKYTWTELLLLAGAVVAVVGVAAIFFAGLDIHYAAIGLGVLGGLCLLAFRALRKYAVITDADATLNKQAQANEEVAKRIKELEKENTSLKSTVQQAQALEKTQKDNISRLEGNTTNLQRELATLKDIEKNANQLRKDLDQTKVTLGQEVERYKQASEELTRSLALMKTDSQNLVNALTSVSGETTELEKQADSFGRYASSLPASITASTKTVADQVVAILAAHKKGIDDLQRKIQQLDASRLAAEQTLKKTELSLQASQEQILKLSSLQAGSAANIAALQTAEQQKAANFKSYSDEIAYNEQLLKQIREQQAALNRQHGEVSQKITDLTKLATEFKKYSEDLQKTQKDKVQHETVLARFKHLVQLRMELKQRAEYGNLGAAGLNAEKSLKSATPTHRYSRSVSGAGALASLQSAPATTAALPPPAATTRAAAPVISVDVSLTVEPSPAAPPAGSASMTPREAPRSILRSTSSSGSKTVGAHRRVQSDGSALGTTDTGDDPLKRKRKFSIGTVSIGLTEKNATLTDTFTYPPPVPETNSPSATPPATTAAAAGGRRGSRPDIATPVTGKKSTGDSQ